MLPQAQRPDPCRECAFPPVDFQRLTARQHVLHQFYALVGELHDARPDSRDLACYNRLQREDADDKRDASDHRRGSHLESHQDGDGDDGGGSGQQGEKEGKGHLETRDVYGHQVGRLAG
eukprot:7390865-Prymnesium_polylepis.1